MTNASWVPVYYGSVSEVLVLQETLDANGIPTVAPDLEHMDLATLGGSGFAVQLLVPRDRLEVARSLVPDSKRAGIPGPVVPVGPVVQAAATTALPRSTGGLAEELGGEA
jgi:hypothetical protein